MRVKKAVVEARELNLLEVFRGSPNLSIKVANDTLKDRDGFRMNLKRIYELWTQARQELADSIKTEAVAV